MQINKRIIYGSIAVCAAAFVVAYALYTVFSSKEEIVFLHKENAASSRALYTSPLDGQPVSSSVETEVQVIGVMIDNHPDARPQSGLSKAKIVYEAMVEGGITRYFALFDSAQNVSEIGPVRSARLYFLDWIQEYGDGLYVHSGGSPQALAAIKPRKIFDANEFFWGRYFWRGTYYAAPHNLYTSSEKLRAMIDYRGVSSTHFDVQRAWQYADQSTVGVVTSSQIKINFNYSYHVAWNYDSTQKAYVRIRNGREEKDRGNYVPISARNVIVQFTEISDIANDDKGRQEIKTTGTGNAMIFVAGTTVYGTWKKDSVKDRTRFYGEDGNEIVFLPGNTWIEVVDKNTEVEIQ